MSSVGCEWDEEGKATLSADGPSGQGVISGITPATAMYFAVILARNARAHGEPWPRVFYPDPFEEAAITALQVELGDRPARVESEPAAPIIDVQSLREHLEQARTSFLNAWEALDGVDRDLHSG